MTTTISNSTTSFGTATTITSFPIPTTTPITSKPHKLITNSPFLSNGTFLTTLIQQFPRPTNQTSTIDGPTFDPSEGTLTELSRISLSCIAILLLIIGLYGNGVTIVLVYRKPFMRSVINFFLAAFAATDFFSLLLCLPLSTAALINPCRTNTIHWLLTAKGLCEIHAIIRLWLTTVNAAILTIISIDRYNIIVSHRDFLSTGARAATAIAISCVTASFLCLLTTMTPPGYVHFKDFGTTECFLDAASTTWERTTVGLEFLVSFALPAVLGGWACARVVTSVKRSRSQVDVSLNPIFGIPADTPAAAQRYVVVSQMMTQDSQRPKAYKEPDKHQTDHCSQDLQEVQNQKPQKVNPQCKSRRLKRRDFHFDLRFKTRAFATIGLLYAAFVVCRGPYAISMLVMNLRGTFSVPLHTYTIWLCFANSALNPLICAWRIAKFRQACFKNVPVRMTTCWQTVCRVRRKGKGSFKSRGRVCTVLQDGNNGNGNSSQWNHANSAI